MEIKLIMLIREHRKIDGASLQDLALVTGLSRQRLSLIENNKVIPRLDEIIKISIAFEMEMKSDLFTVKNHHK